MKTRKKIINGFIILLLGTVSLSFGQNDLTEPIEVTQEAKIDTFTLIKNDLARKGKIYLPASYETNKNLPAIYLIDFTEQHNITITDEFEKVIDGVKQIEGLDALVVTLEKRPDVQAQWGNFQEYYDVFKNMTSYVDSNYTNNTSRTFIGRGSEAGVVLQTLFLEKSETSVFDNFIVTDASLDFNSAVINKIQSDDFPKNKSNKKLHYSFTPFTAVYNTSYKKLTDKINNAQYPWLQFKSVEYKKLSFQSAYPTAYAEGLKYIFNDVPSRLEENSSTSPIEYQLEQNYPNPFNPTTTIKYSIPNVSSGFSLSNVTLKVYDVLGKEVATLVNEKKPTGNYQVKFNASSADGGLTSGIYFYSLTSGSFKKTKKLILIK